MSMNEEDKKIIDDYFQKKSPTIDLVEKTESPLFIELATKFNLYDGILFLSITKRGVVIMSDYVINKFIVFKLLQSVDSEIQLICYLFLYYYKSMQCDIVETHSEDRYEDPEIKYCKIKELKYYIKTYLDCILAIN